MRCCWGSVSISSSRLVRNCARERGPITTNVRVARSWLRVCVYNTHRWLWVPDRARCARLSGTTRLIRFSNSQFRDRHCEPTGRADARPMTGEAIQKPSFRDGPKDQTSDAQLRIVVRCFASPRNDESGLLRRFRLRSWSDGGQVAPRHDGKIRCSPPLTTVVPRACGGMEYAAASRFYH
jgi:hypothetical protein